MDCTKKTHNNNNNNNNNKTAMGTSIGETVWTVQKKTTKNIAQKRTFFKNWPIMIYPRGGPTLVMSYTSTRDPDCPVNC